MGVNVSWGQADKAYLLVEFATNWTWQEFYAAGTQVRTLLQEVDRKIPLIVDFSQTHQLPRGILTHFPAAIQNDHPKRGAIYFVGVDTVLGAVGRMLSRMYPKAAATASVVPTRAIAIQQITQSPTQ
jgi:hypothetical protein